MSSEWIATTLGAVSTWTSGGTPKKDEPSFWDGDIPWISASSMHATRFSDSELKITEAGLKDGSRLAPKDAVLLLVRGSTLHSRMPVGIALREVAFNQDVKAITAKLGQIRPWYLLYWLMGKERFLLDSVVEYTGIGAGKLDTKRMLSLDLLLPPLSEQDEVLEIIKSLDDRISLLRETNTTLEAIAQALFKSWFVDFDPVRAKQQGNTPQGMDAATAALFPDSFEESELGEVPKGWRVGTLQDLLVLQRGFDLPSQDRVPGDFPIIAASGPSGTHFEPMAKGPGVITGRSGVLGRVFLELEDYWPLNTALWVKEFKAATPCYAYEILRLLDFASFNAGSAVPTLNRNHIHTLRYTIPNFECVKAYEEIAIKLHQRVKANEKQAQTLATLRDTLLPRLISGQLRLPA